MLDLKQKPKIQTSQKSRNLSNESINVLFHFAAQEDYKNRFRKIVHKHLPVVLNVNAVKTVVINLSGVMLIIEQEGFT